MIQFMGGRAVVNFILGETFTSVHDASSTHKPDICTYIICICMFKAGFECEIIIVFRLLSFLSRENCFPGAIKKVELGRRSVSNITLWIFLMRHVYFHSSKFPTST